MTNTIVLTLDSDTFNGTPEDDLIYGDTEGLLINQDQGGDDRIFSLKGFDVINGDASQLRDQARGGNDTLRLLAAGTVYGDAALMSDASQGGDDTIRGGKVGNVLHGDARLMFATAAGGHDTIDGNRGDDTLYGDAVFMYQQSSGGDDNLYGGDENDRLYGDAQFLYDQSVGGDDTLKGDGGNDLLYGDAQVIASGAQGGDDTLFGGTGNDTLYGDGAFVSASDGGDDILIGVDPQRGSPGVGELDSLTGNGGRDRFVLGDAKRAYYVGEGIDDHAIVTDFSFADQDIIQLHGSAADYALQNFDLGSVSGVSIFLKGTDEMIGAILNFTAETLAFDSGAFEFVA